MLPAGIAPSSQAAMEIIASTRQMKIKYFIIKLKVFLEEELEIIIISMRFKKQKKTEELSNFCIGLNIFSKPLIMWKTNHQSILVNILNIIFASKEFSNPC